jgi:hypothetical protein
MAEAYRLAKEQLEAQAKAREAAGGGAAEAGAAGSGSDGDEPLERPRELQRGWLAGRPAF